MERYQHYLGIDIGEARFTCAILTRPDVPLVAREEFDNNAEGCAAFEQWFLQHGVTKDGAVFCMEATGVYGEVLSYHLASKDFRLAVEPPLRVKRAFYPKGHKNDHVDSKQIAEYAYRFQDQLYLWKPKGPLVENIATLLATREQLVEQKTATMNALTALKKKVIKNEVAQKIYHENIHTLASQIKQLEQEVVKLFNQDQQFKILVTWLDTAPGVAMLLATNLLVITEGFTKHLDYPHLAAMLGICPYQFRSGSSVWKPDSSAGFGPSRLRKLLHLAARSVSTHNPTFIQYYARKLAEGKPKKLIINNIANKLLRLICAMLREQRPYIKNYVAVNPRLLKRT